MPDVDPSMADYFRQNLVRLEAEHERLFGPKAAAAQARRAALKNAIWQMAVQSLATVVGGGILAGAAVALGWIGKTDDPVWVGVIVFGALLIVIVMAVLSATVPRHTARDSTRSMMIEVVRTALNEAESKDSEEGR